MISLITAPSFEGFNPKSDCNIAFSISFNEFLSQGWINKTLGSGEDTLANWLIGVSLP